MVKLPLPLPLILPPVKVIELPESLLNDQPGLLAELRLKLVGGTVIFTQLIVFASLLEMEKVPEVEELTGKVEGEMEKPQEEIAA